MSDEEELDVHVKLGLEDLCKLRTGKMALGGGGGGGVRGPVNNNCKKSFNICIL